MSVGKSGKGGLEVVAVTDAPPKRSLTRKKKRIASAAGTLVKADPSTVTPVDAPNIVLLQPSLVRLAQHFVEACESCNRDAQLSFDYVLDELTGCDPTITEYQFSEQPFCWACGSPLHPKTRVVVR